MKNFLKPFFEYDHLPSDKQEIGKLFAEIVEKLEDKLEKNPETSTCFRKLLEAKDCAVRSTFFTWEQ